MAMIASSSISNQNAVRASGVISSPPFQNQNGELANLSPKEIWERQERDVSNLWLFYTHVYVLLSVFFGAFWVEMTRLKVEKQQKKHEYHKSFIRYLTFLGFYLSIMVAFSVLICPKRDVILKIASARGRDEDDEEAIKEKNYVFNSIRFSFSLACCSLFLAGIFLFALNHVAEMIGVKALRNDGGDVSLFAMSIDPWPCVFVITALLSVAVVNGFRTYNLITRKMLVKT
ncbi:callose synthase [Corchorus olitorius]|uniref:Callose synthase n=1 Tax=Corchorus olitorius TaxID=93759 RepID=A0A1R3ILT6_9ROSI|nr:callose synthase [Corchorus olitorius]